MYSFLSTKEDKKNSHNNSSSSLEVCDDSEETKAKINIYLKLLYEAEVRRILNCHFIPFTVRRRYASLPSNSRSHSNYEHKVLLRICDRFQQMNTAFTFMATCLRHFVIPRLSASTKHKTYIAFVLSVVRNAEIFLRKYPFRHDFYERILRHSIKNTLKNVSKDPCQALEEEMSLPLQIMFDFIKEQFSLFSMFVLENIDLSGDSNVIETRQMYDELQSQVPELEDLFDQQQTFYNTNDTNDERKENLKSEQKVSDSEITEEKPIPDQDSKFLSNVKENFDKPIDVEDDSMPRCYNNIQSHDVTDEETMKDNIQSNDIKDEENVENDIQSNNADIYNEIDEISTDADGKLFAMNMIQSDYLTLERLQKVILYSPYIYNIDDFPHFIHQLIESSSSGASSVSSSIDAENDS